jgi:hypothetical protein
MSIKSPEELVKLHAIGRIVRRVLEEMRISLAVIRLC